MRQPLFTLGGVSRMTNVRQPTLARWLDHGTIKPDQPSGGSGKYRQFNRNTILKVALAKKLIDIGLSAGPANVAASLVTDQGQRGRAAGETFAEGRTLLVIRPTGPVTINPQFDADFSELSDNGTVFVAIDVGKISNEVDSLIHKTKDKK